MGRVDGPVLLLAPLTTTHDPSHRIRQEPVARPPAAVHRPPSPSSNSTPWRFWHFLLILLATRPPCPDVPPCDPVCLQASPRRLAASGFSLEIQYANHTTSAQHILSAPLISSRAHPNSPHLVSSSTRLPCARGYPPPSPGGSRPGHSFVYSARRRGHLIAHIALHSSPSSLVPLPCSLFHPGAGTSSPRPWSHSSSFSRISKQHSTHPISHSSPHTRASTTQPSRVCAYQQVATILPCSLRPASAMLPAPGLGFPSPSYDEYHTNHIAVSTAVRTDLDGGNRPARSWYTH